MTGEAMEGNTPEQEKRQQEILGHAREWIESVFREGGKYPDIQDRGYFMGAVAVQILAGGYLYVTAEAGPVVAEGWLAEHLRGLGSMLSEGAPRPLAIRMERGAAP